MAIWQQEGSAITHTGQSVIIIKRGASNKNFTRHANANRFSSQCVKFAATTPTPTRHTNAENMLTTATALVDSWVPSTSSIFGAQRGQIVEQLAGVPLPANRNWQTQLGSLWTFPADSSDTTGLGGGITFAFDPELCGRLMPLFREDIAGASFITCDDIKASVFRAFNAWGTNSRFFKFTDVTGECEKMGLLHGGQEEQPHGGCAFAEIWITALTRDESRRRQLQEARRRLATEGEAGSQEEGGLQVESAEQNLDSGGTFVASALSHWRASYAFRYTNGEDAFQWVLTGGEWARQARPVLETYAGTLAYGVDGGSGGVGLCWYLDSDFCSQFHSLKRRMGGPSQARSLMYALLLLASIGTLLAMALLAMALLAMALLACGRYALFLVTSIGTLVAGCGLRSQFWQALCGCGISTMSFKKARAAAPDTISSEEIVDEILQRSTLRSRLANAFEEAAEWNPLLTSLQVMLTLTFTLTLTLTVPPSSPCCR